MIDSTTIFGSPRLRILAADLTTVVKTLWLPFPDLEGGVVLTDVWARAIKQPLLGGGLRFIPGGIRHNLQLTWGLYDPTYTKRGVGTADGQTPELADLYDLLAQNNNGRLSISPGTNKEIWFRVACTSDLTRQTTYPAGFGNVQLTFEGLDVFATATSQIPVA